MAENEEDMVNIFIFMICFLCIHVSVLTSNATFLLLFPNQMAGNEEDVVIHSSSPIVFFVSDVSMMTSNVIVLAFIFLIR